MSIGDSAVLTPQTGKDFFFCAVSLLVRIHKLDERLLNVTKEQNL